MGVSGISTDFSELSRRRGQVTHVLLTRSPLIQPVQAPVFIVRLACVKHAASVRPEPGSNSPIKTKSTQPTNNHKQAASQPDTKIHNRKTPAQHTQPRNEEPGQAHQTKNKTEHPHTNQKSQHAGIPHGIKKLGTPLSSQKTNTRRSSADTSARLYSGKSDRLAPARRASSRCFA